MAARTKRVYQLDETRQKIQRTQLIRRLQDNAFGEITPELTQGQVKSIEILLRKALPDLQAIQISGDQESPLKISVVKRIIVQPGTENKDG